MLKTLYRIGLYIFAIIGILAVALNLFGNYVISNSFEDDDKGYELSASSSNRNYDNYFGEYVYFDHSLSDLSMKLPEPPEGSAVLYGSISMNGEPVPGIKLDLILNGEFKKTELVTDEDGKFFFSVAPGKWVLNGLVTQSWRNMPEHEYMVLSGFEPSISSNSVHYFAEQSPVIVDANSGQETKLVELKLTREISITDPVGSRNSITEFNPASLITWDSHKDADSYRVVISSVTIKENSTSSSTLTKRIVQTNELALSELNTLEDDSSAELTYAVDVYAYDAEGQLVSQSRGFSDNLFKVKGVQIVSDVDYLLSNDGSFATDTKQFVKNQSLLEAVEVLLDDGQLEEAKSLLELTNELAPKGKKIALTAYLSALLGDCERASQLIEKAISDGGSQCTKTKYFAACK